MPGVGGMAGGPGGPLGTALALPPMQPPAVVSPLPALSSLPCIAPTVAMGGMEVTHGLPGVVVPNMLGMSGIGGIASAPGMEAMAVIPGIASMGSIQMTTVAGIPGVPGLESLVHPIGLPGTDMAAAAQTPGTDMAAAAQTPGAADMETLASMAGMTGVEGWFALGQIAAMSESTALLPQFLPGGEPVVDSEDSERLSKDGEEISTLMIGKMPAGTTSDDMVATMSKFGTVPILCLVNKNPSPHGSYSGFARFRSRMEAQQALDLIEAGKVSMGGTMINGRWAKNNSKVARDGSGTASKPPQRPPASEAVGSQTIGLGMLVPPGVMAGSIVPDDAVGRKQDASRRAMGATSMASTVELSGDISTLRFSLAHRATTREDIVRHFSAFGTVLTATVNKRPNPGNTLAGFVRLSSRSEAAAALEGMRLGKVVIQGAALVGEWSHANSKEDGPGSLPLDSEKGGKPDYAVVGRPSTGVCAMPKRGEEVTTLRLSQMAHGTTPEQVSECFNQFGRVITATVNQKPSPDGLFSGYIRFSMLAEAQHVLLLLQASQVSLNGVKVSGEFARQNTKDKQVTGHG
eukprot:gnl/TRDRNA2_/TRDRNA2_170409_c0_seq1.p1 gnl/TRDRNA2_/TRDRNA2_170409_c0~~gnl/TRDRNA2_/TRDRNA2_170409_c0_seq1.p1  ORF type:complete len:631 (+),score=97.65 gnl/TRDRNA2_/TRDRNA2_170409_c0_seq1:170-1894(+)